MAVSYGYVTPSGGFAVEAWFRRTAIPTTNWAVLLSQRTQATYDDVWTYGGDLGRQFAISFSPSTGAVELTVAQEGGDNTYSWLDSSPSGYQNDSQWHHVALTLNATTERWVALYMDGELLVGHDLTWDTNWEPGIFAIGGGYAPEIGQVGHWAWDMRIAYAAITNHVLSQSRIQSHYAAGSGGALYNGDSEVARMIRALGWAEVPPDKYMLDDAVTYLGPTEIKDTNALDVYTAAAYDAGGYAFADGQGIMRYHNRSHRYLIASSMSTTDTSMPEVGLKLATNSAFVYNDIRGTIPQVSTARVVNESSVNAVGRKVYSFEIRVQDPEELLNACAWIASRYGTDTVRFESISFSCETSLELLDMAYARIDVGDAITLELPYGPDTLDFYIESRSLSFDREERTWTVTCKLSPRALENVFIIGTSALDSGAYIPF